MNNAHQIIPSRQQPNLAGTYTAVVPPLTRPAPRPYRLDKPEPTDFRLVQQQRRGRFFLVLVFQSIWSSVIPFCSSLLACVPCLYFVNRSTTETSCTTCRCSSLLARGLGRTMFTTIFSGLSTASFVPLLSLHFSSLLFVHCEPSD